MVRLPSHMKGKFTDDQLKTTKEILKKNDAKCAIISLIGLVFAVTEVIL